MAKCDFCGKEVAYPYKCRYCGGIFCEDHRLPPNHNCINIDLWRMREPPSPSGSPSGGKGILISEPYVVRRTNSRRRSRIKVDKKVALVVILLALAGLVYYAHASGYYNLNNLKEPVTNLQSSFNVPSIEQFKTESNPKEAYLKSYPVKVWYEFKTVKKREPISGKVYTMDVVRLYFENIGSETASFVIGGVAIVDDDGNQYSPTTLIAGFPVTVYPNGKKYVDILFKSYPKKGKLYVDIYEIGDVGVERGGWTMKYKKLETVRLYFEAESSK